MTKRHVKHPFGAVISHEARVLILGSVPSCKSVEKGFYYMHPQNRFWKVMSALLDEPLVEADISARAEILSKRGVALYDSVEECDIEGSSDSQITNVVPADLPALIGKAQIRRIFLNGNASYMYAAKYYPALVGMMTRLPSTSPANASYSLERLIEEWRVILEYL